MNKKTLILIALILLLAVPAVDAWSWNPATWISRAFKIGDSKDIDLNGQAVGNGYAWNITCGGNCTNFNGTTGAPGADGAAATNYSNITQGKMVNNTFLPAIDGANITTGIISNAILSASVVNFWLPCSYLVEGNSTSARAYFCQNKTVAYNGNISYVLQSISDMQAGDDVYIQKGIYNFTGLPTVLLKRHIRIRGSLPWLGELWQDVGKGTVLYTQSSTPIFSVDGNAEIYGIAFEAAIGTAGHFINLTQNSIKIHGNAFINNKDGIISNNGANVYNIRIADNMFQNQTGDALNLSFGSNVPGVSIEGNWFRKLNLNTMTGRGINVSTGGFSSGRIISNMFDNINTNITGSSIFLGSSWLTDIDENHFEGNSTQSAQWVISATNCYMNSFQGNVVDGGYNGLKIDGCKSPNINSLFRNMNTSGYDILIDVGVTGGLIQGVSYGRLSGTAGTNTTILYYTP